MKIESLLYYTLLAFSYCLLAMILTGHNFSSNEMTHFRESYATNVSTSDSSRVSNNGTDSNGVKLFEQHDDDLFSEFNITGNNSLTYQSFLALGGRNSSTSDDAVLNGTVSENISSPSYLNVTETGSSPNPGILQIPYTGLSTYHLTPAVSKLFGLNETTYAMLITGVEPGSPAAEEGIRSGNVTTRVAGEIIKVGGDIILEVDSNTSVVRNNDAFINYLQNEKRVGDNITLTILRDGQTKDIEMTIGAVPRFLWYDNKDEGIRMKFPSDWRVDESHLSKQDIVKFFAPEITDVNNDTLPIAGVFVKVAPTTSSLDEFASAQQEGTPTTRTLDMYLTTISNLPGYEIVFYDYADRERTLKILSVFTIKDDQIYRINFAADPPSYDDYLSLAREMVESFLFTK